MKKIIEWFKSLFTCKTVKTKEVDNEQIKPSAAIEDPKGRPKGRP